MHRPTLTLLFRDKRMSNHSMERLFAALAPHFQEEFDVRQVHVPKQPSGLMALLANTRHARAHAKGFVHVTGDAHYLVPFLPKGKTILTIHDCGYLMKLRGWKKRVYRWLWFTLPCRFAAKVTVISESTRDVLFREVGDFSHKVTVIEDCLPRCPGATNRRAFNPNKPKILQIGTGRHKNLDTLIRAVEGMACELKIVGKLSQENREALVRLGVEFTDEHAVSDDRLDEIYAECDLLFFASRHEGFGLPILEAQSVGMPVITSNRYSMPKVAGGAALLVDPESPEEIREAITRLREDAGLRQELTRKGLENVTLYSPSAIARRYMDLYHATLGTGRKAS